MKDAVSEYLAAERQADRVPRRVRASAVRQLLQELAQRAPGRAVELRVPPDGVIQAVAGPQHRRGTPGASVEMSPATFLDLALGRATWSEEVSAGSVLASGERADLSEYLPLRNA